MPRACSICTHAERGAIDEAMLTCRGSIRAISRRFAVSSDALERHRAHIARKVEKAQAREGRTLLGVLDKAHADLDKAQELAVADDDGGTLVRAVQARAKLAEVEFGTKAKVEIDLTEIPTEELEAAVIAAIELKKQRSGKKD